MNIIRNSILSGIFISLAGLGNLILGGVLGAFLFSAGLMGIISTGSFLYTGRIYVERNYLDLGKIILGNMIGCCIGGLLSRYSYPDIVSTASTIITARCEDTIVAIIWKSIGCGTLMTAAVLGMKENNPWPLLLGIPLFVLTGLYHSIADGFYFFVSPNFNYIPVWIMIVIGNLIGGKLGWIKK